MLPGDVAAVHDEGVEIQRAAAPFVEADRDTPETLRFDPTSPVPPLEDPNLSGYSRPELERSIRTLVCEQLYPYAKATVGAHLSVPFAYRQSGAVFGLRVILPWGTLEWELDFRGPQVRIREGHADATVLHRIAGSVLVDWLEHKRSYFSVRAYSRRFSTLSHLVGNVTGTHAFPVRLPDLLIDYVLNAAPGSAEAAKTRIDAEIARAIAG